MMNNNLSNNLKRIRKDNNLSQEQLAEELGVSRQAISKWESGIAYPEMDKIMQICKKFDISIDELLHGNVNEIKREKVSRKNINNVVDSFLNFITDTINMFSNMTFKSKIKCLIEQCIIVCILFILFSLLGSFIIEVVYGLFNMIPENIFMYIRGVIRAIYILFVVPASIAILVYVFKTRYLDYYDKVINIEKDEDIDKNVKVEKSDNKKIVIRDPKHSEYRFINVLLKLFILCIKFFLGIVLLFLVFGLICLSISFILSFIVIKTGLLFIGLILSILSLSIIYIDICLLLLNFIFNRKNNKPIMIWSFIGSIIVFGIGIGIMCISFLSFDIVDKEVFNEINEVKELEMDMNDKLFFNNHVTYIEKNIDSVIVSSNINKLCNINYSDDYGIYIYDDCDKPMELVKQWLSYFNKKKVIYSNGYLLDIKVYASKDNIDIMKNNYKYYND